MYTHTWGLLIQICDNYGIFDNAQSLQTTERCKDRAVLAPRYVDVATFNHDSLSNLSSLDRCYR